MTTKLIYVALLALCLGLFACEDVINPNLEEADPVLVIDAWVDNIQDKQQVIKLTDSQSYFDDSLPPGVSGATVSITDNEGEVFQFVESTSNTGEYIWSPVDGASFGSIGNEYTLTVAVSGEIYEATSTMNRVATLDSVTFNIENDDPTYPEDSHLAEFWARDLVGDGDSYWIKSYKNGQLLNRPDDITLAFDAGFSDGGNFDGVAFILPIRRGINPVDGDENDEILKPWVTGDSVFVEIHSITNDAFDYLNEVIIQTDRPGGFAELFSNPLANVSTNIVNNNPSGKRAVGFFNVSAVSAMGKRCPDCTDE